MSKRFISLFLCVLLLLIAASVPAAAEGEDQVEYYVVPYEIQNGDSFTQIYQRWGLRLDKYADVIRALNGVDDLDVLFIGSIYLLPTTEENVQTDEYVTVVSHVMHAGETAYQVFTSYGFDYNQSIGLLQRYNGGIDLARINIGDKLLIPLV